MSVVWPFLFFQLLSIVLFSSVLNRLIDYLRGGDRTLREWRTVWRVAVMWKCLLRWDDIQRLTVSLLQKSLNNFLRIFLF